MAILGRHRHSSTNASVRNHSGHTLDSETGTIVTTGLFLIPRGCFLLYFHFPPAPALAMY